MTESAQEQVASPPSDPTTAEWDAMTRVERIRLFRAGDRKHDADDEEEEEVSARS